MPASNKNSPIIAPTGKHQISTLLQKPILDSLESTQALTDYLHRHLLLHKVKFPLLEYAATLVEQGLNQKQVYTSCAQIHRLNTIGGNVIIGKMLQLQINHDLNSAFKEAAQFMQEGQLWYVSDIIGERVWGFGLLNQPESSIAQLKEFSLHPSTWVVRGIGAGTHYAVKKGLPQSWSEQAFKLLLTLAQRKEHPIKTGIGWAAKTVARYHPEIVNTYQNLWNDPKQCGRWFTSKIEKGLARNQYYAQRNKS